MKKMMGPGKIEIQLISTEHLSWKHLWDAILVEINAGEVYCQGGRYELMVLLCFTNFHVRGCYLQT